VSEVRWRRCAAVFERHQESHFVVDPLLNGQQCPQQRAGMGSSLSLENNPSCTVLYLLQLRDAVAWSAVEHSVAVVDPGQDQTTGQGLCQFCSQQVLNVSDGRSD